MLRSILVGALLVAMGAAAARLLDGHRTAIDPARDEPASPRPAPARRFGPIAERADRERNRDGSLERRLDLLEARLAEEAGERQRLEERCDALAAEIAAIVGGAGETAPALTIGSEAPPASEAPSGLANDQTGPVVSSNAAADAAPTGQSLSEMERGLLAAGIDAETATDIKRRRDDLAMAEIDLRDQATRERWLDSPRFAEEMKAIEAERTSIRDEIGDDAYDRYLAVMGRPNRVRVEDVMSESPAAQAGLQPGDMIVRYGESRLFSPNELVAATHEGDLNETVRLEVVRQDQLFEVEVPRGPLGLRIGAIIDQPR
jgi:hypothetical protein